MSWIADDPGPWALRRVVTVDATTIGPSGLCDVVHALPPFDDELWANMRPKGADLRVCAGDGCTPVVFNARGVDVATRTGAIEVQAWPAPAARVCALFLYFGNPGASSAATPFTPSSPVPGRVELGLPSARVCRVRPEPSGATRPSAEWTKGAAEALFVDFDFGDLLEPANVPAWGRSPWEEIAYVDATTVEAAGVDQPAMHVATRDRIVDGGRVRVWVAGGAPGAVYTVSCRVVTARPGGAPSARTLEGRALLYVVG